MSHRGGEPADGGVLFRLDQRRFSLLLLRDVDIEAHNTDRLAIGRPHRSAERLNPVKRAIWPNDTEL